MKDIWDHSVERSFNVYGKGRQTKSSNRETKMTRKICFRLAGDTGVTDIVGSQYGVGDVDS